MPRSRSETSRSPSRASTVARSVPARAPISRRVSGFSATNRSASRAASVSSIGGGARSHGRRRSPSARRRRLERLGRVRLVSGVGGHANDSRVSSSGASSSDRRRRPRPAPRRSSRRATIGPHGSACSTTISRRFMSSSMARNVTAMTTRSRTPGSRSWRTTVGASRSAARMIAARSVSVIDARHDLGRRLGRRRDRGQPVERARRAAPGRAVGASAGRAPASAGGVGGARLAPEQPDPPDAPPRPGAGRRRGTPGRAAAGREARPRGRCLRRRAPSGRRIGAAREHRPALDQDQLAGDRHERADVAQPVRRRASRARRGRRRRAPPSGTVRTSSWRASMSDSSSASGPSNSAIWTCVAALGPAALAEPDRRDGRVGRRGRSEPLGRGHDRDARRRSRSHQLASSASRSSSPNSGSSGASW